MIFIILVLAIIGTSQAWHYSRLPGQIFFEVGERMSDYPFFTPILCRYCLCWWMACAVAAVLWFAQYLSPIEALCLPGACFAAGSLLFRWVE